MFTKVTTVEELKQLYSELFLNKTNRVTKVSDHSVMNGVAYGVAKIGQKAIKDIALVESHLFPDSAYGDAMDYIADNFGISARFASSKSSMFVAVFATPGTVYTAGVHEFYGFNGIRFEIENSTTVGSDGYAYIKIRSKELGLKTNVEALTVNKVSPIPNGHIIVMNEYCATGGRDAESDDLFRKRIKEGSNKLARGTISMLEQVFMSINSDVLKIFYAGTDVNGKALLQIATQNGVDLTAGELAALLQNASEYFNFVDLKPYDSTYVNVVLENIEYDYIDIKLRISLLSSADPDTVRREIQRRFTKELDFTKWNVFDNKVQWDNLLELVKRVRGVKYVPDNYFWLNGKNADYVVAKNSFPRIRSFIMYDIDGTVLSDNNNQVSSVYYPNQVDVNLSLSVI